jgi:hypothetical protein
MNEPIFSEEICFEEDLNESEVKGASRFNPSRIGECKVEVYSNEGEKPHFHIYKIGDKSEFETCICIYSNEYFSHGGKYASTFNSKQCKELNKWLSQQNKRFPIFTNWGAIVYEWERGNGGMHFTDKTDSQPEYDKMNKFNDMR